MMPLPFNQVMTREFWLGVHTILALTAGLLFVVLGLSGTLSVYREELDLLLNPALALDHPQKEMLPLDSLMAAVKEAHPRRHAPWTLELPRTPDRPATAWYARPEETAGRLYAPLMVSVNPYTGEVLASRFWGHTAATWLADLHTQMLAGRRGWNLVGMLGLLMLVSAGSGLCLWWPGLSRLRLAFRLRHDGRLMQLALDMHRGIGFIAAGWLLLVAFTGFNLAFPKLGETMVGDTGMSHGNEGQELRSTAIPNDHPLNLAQAVLVARGPFPRAEVRRVTQPAGETGSYRINLRQRGEINQRHPFTTVWVDRWSGQILDVKNPARFSGGQSFLAWLWPLHTGEAFGAGGRFAWFCAGTLPLLLYLTGLLRWLHRRAWVRDRPVNLDWSRADLAARARSLLTRARPGLERLLAYLRSSLIGYLLALQRQLERIAAGSQRKSD